MIRKINSRVIGRKNCMDKIVQKVAALGVPGLVLVVAISATGLAGGAAITAALAALGPGGMIGGIAGLTQVTLSGMCQINFFDGYEMTSIAAVVLGGANIAGGSGTVIGTFLGVLLMKLISNNLILLGIPTEWSKLMTGVLIILGVCFSSYKAVAEERNVMSNILGEEVTEA